MVLYYHNGLVIQISATPSHGTGSTNTRAGSSFRQNGRRSARRITSYFRYFHFRRNMLYIITLL